MLVHNAIKTPDGTIIQSRHRHDFVCHVDANGKRYCVDGGLEYLKRSCEDNDYTDLHLNSEDPIEKIREIFDWGTYGKKGKEPLHYIILKDMEDSHIENILYDYEADRLRISEVISDMLKKELKYRLLLKMNKLDDEN